MAVGLFLVEAATQYANLTVAQQSKFAACFIQKMLQEKALRKSQDEALLKQMRLTKKNHRKNLIRIEKDKMKKSLTIKDS